MAAKKKVAKKNKKAVTFVAIDLIEGHARHGDSPKDALSELREYCGNYSNPAKVIEVRYSKISESYAKVDQVVDLG
jgi:hypothetical protein